MNQPVDFYRLVNGQCYTVVKSLTDHYGNDFSAGEKLIFIGKRFLPYDGGYMLFFENRQMYLQEDKQRQIIESFNDYLMIANAPTETAG